MTDLDSGFLEALVFGFTFVVPCKTWGDLMSFCCAVESSGAVIFAFLRGFRGFLAGASATTCVETTRSDILNLVRLCS